MLLVAAVVNTRAHAPLGVVYAKNLKFRPAELANAGPLAPREVVVDWSAWNTYSFVSVQPPVSRQVFYWGRGRGGEHFHAISATILIDAEAATPITKWDGDVDLLDWVGYDVTSLPYHLRRGRAGVIGVGGGRDILSALWGRSVSVTGIDINANVIRALRGPYRDLAGFTDRPDVDLVLGEARSYLTRTDRRFDVLQMSLIDTWAATGAGAFTLSENGLYTREAWKVFLDRLTPGGIFSVSRWFSPDATSETSRLLALAVAALQARGVREPARHMALLSADNVATLIVSNEPLTDADRITVVQLAAARGFKILISPWTSPTDSWLGGIAASSSRRALMTAIQHPMFDFTPPTDDRPFFFNTLKPGSFYKVYRVPRDGVVWGNLRATWTLVLLFTTASVLVVALIGAPLLWSGLPRMSGGSFGLSAVYFATIGIGYMLIQIPLLQRFSVYLGHPTYTPAIILFSMVLCTGIGSFISDRFPVDRHRWVLWIPAAIALILAGMVPLLQPLIDATIKWPMAGRATVVLACMAPLSILLGFCFPIGMTLVGRLSDQATAWMWGINGAAGVLASIGAVGISMWLGVHVNLLTAAALYLMLTVPARVLARRAYATSSRSQGGPALI
jgi:hypothetical protein